MRNNRHKFAAVAVIGLVAAGGSAFTAANTGTPVASAGFQATDTAGYAVSGVKYQFGANASAATGTGNDVAAVEFTLTPTDSAALPAKQARIRLVKADNYYTNCTSGAPDGTTKATTWSCVTGTLEASAIDTLDIVAVSQDPVTPPVA